MRNKKLSESVLKRSILKQLKTRRQEVSKGAAIGNDCALFSFGEEALALSAASFEVTEETMVFSEVIASVNNVAASGAIPVGILVSAVLPEEIEEARIKSLAAEVERACCRLNIQAAGGNTRISREIRLPQLTITTIGKIHEKRGLTEDYRPGQDVVMTKWTGLAATAFLAKQNRSKLLNRLPAYFLDEAEAFESFISIIPEADIAVKQGAVGMHDVSRGGIFSALWELAEGAKMGLEIDLKKLPIRQETIEICEILGKNPYELYGAGSLLIVCERGSRLVNLLKQQNIPAAVIGKMTEGKAKAKILWNQEEKRFLDRP